MVHPHKETLDTLFADLQISFDSANNLPPELSAIKLRVQNNIRLLQNIVSSISGGTMRMHEEPTEVKPLETVMGQPIMHREPVTAERLLPEEEERARFLKSRDHLYDKFLSLKNDSIFTQLKMPGGEALIRAVAKKSGIADYMDAPINTFYINAIKIKMQEEAAAKKELEKADKMLNATPNT